MEFRNLKKTGRRTSLLSLLFAAALAIGCFSAFPPEVAQADTVTARNGTVYDFTNSPSAEKVDQTIVYGRDTDVTLFGDWDGDGVDTVCVRRGNVYYFKNSLSGGDADIVVAYGKAEDEVLTGDWNGDGTDTLAVRRGNVYYLKNSVSSGEADIVVVYGKTDDYALPGDWDGDGMDTLAVRRVNEYYIKNSIAPGDADEVAVYGKPVDSVLVGDWDGNGTDTLAVRRGYTYYIKNSIANGDADVTLAWGKYADIALSGDWNGNGTDTLAVRHRNVSGTDVVNYACQFVGNPYVWDGTSLTDGCDCSGFVLSVYDYFGILLPHSSYELRFEGYEVPVSDMQPGDIVCYEGHCGIYVGNGQIVNAYNSQPYPKGGIRYVSATFKNIITVRRIF